MQYLTFKDLVVTEDKCYVTTGDMRTTCYSHTLDGLLMHVWLFSGDAAIHSYILHFCKIIPRVSLSFHFVIVIHVLNKSMVCV